ncbi:MAG TPA: DUF1269 domain-containing protein [Bryobacteraceae bacterium]|nr:DUF1269 domain-containing protein [Bryobacteraceae bacterium]
MEKMLVAVFDNESKAYEGSRALAQLDADGSIAVHAQAVIKKNPDGTATVKELNDEFPVGSVAGTAVGSLIGLLEGPVGVAVGATTGLFAGMVRDLFAAGVDAEFVDDTAAILTAGKCAVVADVSEEWETPVDTKMEALGATVIRTPRQAVEQDQRAREAAALREEIDQLKAEYARAKADRKARIQARIDQLNARLQARLDQARQRSEQIKSETEAKVQALQKKAAKAQGDIKATLDARAKHIREEYEQSVAKEKHLLAGQLKAAAAKLEK